MAKEIFMPKLSSTMAVGTLLQWFKEEGDTVEISEPIFEIMTDKINIEVEAYDQGVLLKKYFDVDEEVPVNQIIGYIGDVGENVPESSPGISGSEEEKVETLVPVRQEVPNEVSAVVQDIEKPRATPAARRLAHTTNLELVFIQGSGPKGRVHKKDVVAYLETATAPPKATPLASKVALTEQVDLSSVTGSGTNGKIVKGDVVAAIAPQSAEPVPVESERQKMSGMRKVIAERMSQSAFTAPHVTLTTEVEITKVKELRANLLPVIEKITGFRVSFTDILVKALGTALARHPQVNVSIDGDELVFHSKVNIGLAVAVSDGLMVPVIKDVLSKGLAELTKETKDISQRARDYKLLPGQLKESTFTISNLGMYAIDTFTPIINQPESAILGVGRIQDKPIAINGALEIRPMMALSLSFDHRAMDGAPAAAFLTELKQILENPFELLI